MKAVATLTSKGQITIPRVVRQTLGVHAGDALEFDLRPGKIEIRAARPKQISAGVLKTYLPAGWRPPKTAEMDAGIGAYLARKHRPT